MAVGPRGAFVSLPVLEGVASRVDETPGGASGSYAVGARAYWRPRWSQAPKSWQFRCASVALLVPKGAAEQPNWTPSSFGKQTEQIWHDPGISANQRCPQQGHGWRWLTRVVSATGPALHHAVLTCGSGFSQCGRGLALRQRRSA